MSEMEITKYKFSFGPWNIHEGADPFGPPIRSSFTFDEKLGFFKDLGFEAIQFHDDDAVPGIKSAGAGGHHVPVYFGGNTPPPQEPGRIISGGQSAYIAAG